MDNFFINALVQASSCRKHAKHTQAWQEPIPNASLQHRPRRKRALGVEESVKGFSHSAKSRGPEKADTEKAGPPAPADQKKKLTPEQLKSIVDFYGPNDGHLETWKEEEEREAREAREARRAEEETEASEGPAKRRKWVHFDDIHKPWENNDEIDNAAIGELEELLQHEELAPEIAFEVYSQLSWPRAAYLSYETIRNLLHCLGVVRKYTEESMVRYLSVIDDMKAASIPIALTDWNMAIQFAGRCFRKITHQEVEKALYLWRDMEHKSGTKGNHVTFNILFDISVKAGKYKMAEMIQKEMRKRKLKLDRYFRTGVIMWRGLTGDGEGVRIAYRELVEAGEIVDTTVMNCVVSALIKAGEPASAEQVFLRMKTMHSSRKERKQMPNDWRQRRELGYLLTRATEHIRGDADLHKRVQDESPVAPDYATFKILIEYHAIKSGNIDRLTQLLDEMDRVYRIPFQGDVYYTLLSGFYIHGGVRYGLWTKERLDSTWRAFMLSLDSGNEEFYLDRAVVKAALLAYAKCVSKEKTLQLWEQIQTKWKNMRQADRDVMVQLLASIYPATGPVSRLD